MSYSAFALVDCNNFFVSCERLFRPRLLAKPVVVLSNNDGCVIARSEEAKALGIQMGHPVFQCEDILRRHKVTRCSSNFALYEDISYRVMSVLSSLAEEIEVYSVDEAFLLMRARSAEEFFRQARFIKTETERRTGIPVSVGVAATKTLAKIANSYAKRRLDAGLSQFNLVSNDKGVSVLLDDLDFYLKPVSVDKIWGIGRGYIRFLCSYGIRSAVDLKNANISWLRQQKGVTLARTALELGGKSCHSLELGSKPNKNLMVSRTFGEKLHRYEDVLNALINFTATAARRMRSKSLAAASLTVFLRAFDAEHNYRYLQGQRYLSQATFYTPRLCKLAAEILAEIFVPGLTYLKAGVQFSSLLRADQIQTNIFSNDFLQREEALMKLMDNLASRYGTQTLFPLSLQLVRERKLSSEGKSSSREPDWRTRSQYLSRAYSSSWADMLIIS